MPSDSGRHVEQQHGAVAGDQDVGLERGAERHHLVRVQLAMRRPAEQILDQAPHQRHARRSPDEHDFVDHLRRQSGVVQRLPAGADGPLDDRPGDRLELCPRHRPPPREAGKRRDAADADLGPIVVGEGPLGQDRGPADDLHGLGVSGQVDPDLGEDQVHQPPVDVVSTEVGVAVGREDLEDPLLDTQDRDVEGAAAEVVDGDGPVTPPVQAVGQRRGGRFVDDPQHLEAGQPAGVARGGPLGVVEVGRHGDDGAVHVRLDLARAGEEGLGPLLQLPEDEGRDLGRREGPIAEADLDDASLLARHGEREQRGLAGDVLRPATHEPLDRVDRAVRIGDEPPFGLAPDVHGPLGIHRDDGGKQAVARFVADDGGRAVDDVRHEAVGGAEVDSDDFAHDGEVVAAEPRSRSSDASRLSM